MSIQKPSSIIREAMPTQETTAPSSSTGAADYGSWSPETLARIADLVADGSCPFPKNLPNDVEEKLAGAVRQRRRARLIKVIARAIALELHRTSDEGLGCDL